jgi:hypothetical protein
MYIQTDNAEHYMKLIHYFCYSLVIALSIRISQAYFRHSP